MGPRSASGAVVVVDSVVVVATVEVVVAVSLVVVSDGSVVDVVLAPSLTHAAKSSVNTTDNANFRRKRNVPFLPDDRSIGAYPAEDG